MWDYRDDDGYLTIVEKKVKKIAKSIMVRIFFDHEMPCGRKFRRNIEKEEQEDENLKILRRTSSVTGDLSVLMAYKRMKKAKA